MVQSIGIIGGTGRQGSAFAKRLQQQGYQVRIGSRSQERGSQFAENLNAERSSTAFSGGDNLYALQADVVVLAIPFDQVDVLVTPHADLLSGKIILDMTVNLKFGKFITTLLQDGKSSYEYIRDVLPDSHVVACLKTISYALLDTDVPLNQSDLHMTTSDEAFELSSKICQTIGLEVVRVRGKMHAHTIERMVALSIQLNKQYPGSHVGFQLTDIKG